MPNFIAYIALSCWPIFSIVLYKKMDTVSATFWCIFGGYLILPAGMAIDPPLLPPLNQETIPPISALIGCLVIKKLNISIIPKQGIEKILVLTIVLIPLITFLTNTEPYFNGAVWIAGLEFRDMISSVLQSYLGILSFILGMQIIKSHEDQTKLFKLITIALLAYSILILFEIRMSPQLHTWLYGYFPHEWGQQKRMGGFRAVVFVGHGLLVSLLLAIALACGTALWKNKEKVVRFSTPIILIYLLLVLILSKSLGALIIGLFLILMLSTLAPIAQQKTTYKILLLFLIYPVLSIFDLIPKELLVGFFNSIDPDRAQSLAYRFYHEGRVIEHALDKPIFGWGGWGRNRLEDSVIDGFWILVMGKSGLVGLFSLFGLFSLGVYRALQASNKINNMPVRRILIAHALIGACILLDQVLNHTLYTALMFFMGALLGRANTILKQQRGS